MNSRIFRLIVFFLAIVLFTIIGQPAFCDPLIKGPYLMLAAKPAIPPPAISPKVVDNTAMTIHWEGDEGALSKGSCTLEWGETLAYGKTPIKPDTLEESPPWFSYTIRGLAPGALTYYRLICKGERYTGAFRTPPADASALTFFAYGDTRGDNDEPSSQKYVLMQMKKNIEDDAAKPYTLCLHTGDFVQRGQVKREWDRNDTKNNSQFFNREDWSRWFLSHLPVAGVLGNHEGYKQGGTDTADFGQNFKNYWPYPFYPDDRDAFYYGFDYGPAHFSVIDGNDRINSCRKDAGTCRETGRNATVAGLKDGTAQYDWLVNDLGSAKRWKIVAIHNPLYAATGPRDRFRDAPALITNLHNLFKAKGVKLVLQGHNHYYSSRVVDGITYLTLGGGGAPLSDSDPKLGGKRIYQFGRFDITGNSLTYTIVDSSGKVAEKNTITIP